ncbi:TonB family protein [Helicobacter aurati]|uniref:TonB family protein n=1 Tax=Helicobacter aurati TaxID=137778 RepID=A0A3D8J761_9HELI|nr:TonB family protein [Helicobacter aurati]RDU73333.1 TonB family protein [Helicobacter aurati]
MTRQYKVYKDRFLLSLGLSILAHGIIILCYILLPKPDKHISLQPISLGILQNNVLQKLQNSTQQIPQHATQTKKLPTTQVPSKIDTQPKSNQRTTQPQTTISPQLQEQTINRQAEQTPDLNIDLESLNLPQEKFNPLIVTKPSLTQSIQEKEENVKLEKLPSQALEELQRLYGNNIYRMSKEQKDYLAESYFINFAVFQQTADRMGYPKLAAYLKQQGEGIIEFTLYPDGHIEDIRIIVSTKYEVLDESMRQVVELSAKNLKRPPIPIQVRLGGKYQIR